MLRLNSNDVAIENIISKFVGTEHLAVNLQIFILSIMFSILEI